MLKIYYGEIRSFLSSNDNMDTLDKIAHLISLLLTFLFMKNYSDPICVLETTLEKVIRIAKVASMLFVVSTFLYGIYRTIRVLIERKY